MSHGVKHFIKELQESSEARKKRWIIGCSTAAMLVVFSFWLVYISATIKDVTTGSAEQVQAQASEDSFWPIMKRGAAMVYQNISSFVWKKIETKKEITVEKKDETFQNDAVEPITPQEIK